MNFCSREELGMLSKLEVWDEYDIFLYRRGDIYENMLRW